MKKALLAQAPGFVSGAAIAVGLIVTVNVLVPAPQAPDVNPVIQFQPRPASWYKDPANAAKRTEWVIYCQDNPGVARIDPNCAAAAQAASDLSSEDMIAALQGKRP
jgi:hypothetical protein